MMIKCECDHCDVNIEFDLDSFVERGRNSKKIIGQEVQCPICQKNTNLYLPNNQHAETKPNKSNDRHIEGTLEAVGYTFFILGLIGLVIGGVALVALFSGNLQPDQIGTAIAGLGFGIISFFQGCVFLVLFKAIAEIIRLLRKLVAKA